MNLFMSINAQIGTISPEKCIPDTILKQAKGLAILTVAKVGTVMTYKVGTGLVVARRKDGSWSAPSAIASFGLGWGVQVRLLSFFLDVAHRSVYILHCFS